MPEATQTAVQVAAAARRTAARGGEIRSPIDQHRRDGANAAVREVLMYLRDVARSSGDDMNVEPATFWEGEFERLDSAVHHLLKEFMDA